MHSKMVYHTLAVTALLVSFARQGEAQQRRALQFGQFPAKVYRGPVHLPREIHKDADGLWHDEMGKPAAAPVVNFAGEYYLAVHSCGTCCRFYTLDNLRTGVKVGAISMFDAGDLSPRTKDGRTYVPILLFKPGSRLLLVQYQLDLCTPEDRNECRQAYFLFEKGHFRSISRMLPYCTRQDEQPE